MVLGWVSACQGVGLAKAWVAAVCWKLMSSRRGGGEAAARGGASQGLGFRV